MKQKAKLVVFDGDLKATVKNYPVSDSGDRINVKKGGEAHFMPSFDNSSFLDLPYRSLSSPWKISYKRTYFARKLSKKCVDFQTEIIEGPSPEFVKEMAAKVMLDKLNKQKQETVWQIWLILVVSIFTLLYVMGVIV